ncbi:WG repeat-containing protein [Campylobacter lari]|nr:WG repeat-containing protein [Campylobacter lari]MCR6535957.1 WG repeat-containing protein [Campylobacter lari]
MASVRLNGKYGFIDKNGNFIVEPIFDDIDYY